MHCACVYACVVRVTRLRLPTLHFAYSVRGAWSFTAASNAASTSSFDETLLPSPLSSPSPTLPESCIVSRSRATPAADGARTIPLPGIRPGGGIDDTIGDGRELSAKIF